MEKFKAGGEPSAQDHENYINDLNRNLNRPLSTEQVNKEKQSIRLIFLITPLIAIFVLFLKHGYSIFDVMSRAGDDFEQAHYLKGLGAVVFIVAIWAVSLFSHKIIPKSKRMDYIGCDISEDGILIRDYKGKKLIFWHDVISVEKMSSCVIFKFRKGRSVDLFFMPLSFFDNKRDIEKMLQFCVLKLSSND